LTPQAARKGKAIARHHDVQIHGAPLQEEIADRPAHQIGLHPLLLGKTPKFF